MNNLIVIEQNNQRVLTTQQLAEAFGTEKQVIINNFNRNKERYKEGKHLIGLTGQEKLEFIDLNQIELGSKNAQTLYLWTEKGAWLHAKSLNTDEAWEAYEKLVDDYYTMGSQLNGLENLSPQLQLLINIERQQKVAEQRFEVIEQTQEALKEVVSLNSNNWRQNANTLIRKIAMKFGGDANAYREVSNDIYKEVDRRGNCDLERRLINKKKRMAYEGATKTAVKNLNKLDIIAEDNKILELFVSVIKECAIRNGVTDFQFNQAVAK
jgi:phage regulator Rha-like protein